jgi:DNA-binding phage protein
MPYDSLLRDPADYLHSEEEIAHYLRAITEACDPELLAYAQTVAARARERLRDTARGEKGG